MNISKEGYTSTVVIEQYIQMIRISKVHLYPFFHPHWDTCILFYPMMTLT